MLGYKWLNCEIKCLNYIITDPDSHFILFLSSHCGTNGSRVHADSPPWMHVKNYRNIACLNHSSEPVSESPHCFVVDEKACHTIQNHHLNCKKSIPARRTGFGYEVQYCPYSHWCPANIIHTQRSQDSLHGSYQLGSVDAAQFGNRYQNADVCKALSNARNSNREYCCYQQTPEAFCTHISYAVWYICVKIKTNLAKLPSQYKGWTW